mmetsp:Transcript_41391/g.90390  ORF Transcript_41391/g.90390 Transcript_41391/m.90390 type:complete len:453 (-) Transcript_41391:76-1434(-)
MMSFTDLSEASVLVPLSQCGKEHESDVYCNVLLFRANGNPFVAIISISGDRPPPALAKLESPADLDLALDEAVRQGLLFPVSKPAFEGGPTEAVSEALASTGRAVGVGSQLVKEMRAARLLDPEAMVAPGDGAVFRPFRFPTKMSEAFRLPWSDTGKVKDEQLQNFYRGSQMYETPPRVVGAIIYLHHHYLVPFKQKITSRGRHLLVIHISEGSGRQPKRRCLAWWMPLYEVRDRFADPAQADMYSHRGSVHRVCHLVETYNISTTVPIHFEFGERPHHLVGGIPLNCYDVAPDFKTQWHIGSTPEELLEERREVAQCLERREPLEKSMEAKKADKRRRKRQNRKAREREKAAGEAAEDEAAVDAEREQETEEEQRREQLLKPNAALRESGFLDSLLEEMRQRRAVAITGSTPVAARGVGGGSGRSSAAPGRSLGPLGSADSDCSSSEDESD